VLRPSTGYGEPGHQVRSARERGAVRIPGDAGVGHTCVVSITIRAATAGDAPRVAQIYVDSWNAGFGDLMPTLALDESRIHRWVDTLASGPSARPTPSAGENSTHSGMHTATPRWWVADRAGSVVGFVGICPSRDPVDPELGEVDTIAVDPLHWRSGVGSALMRTALHALRDDGYRSAILWTLADYDRGQRFYLAAGWTADGGTRDGGRQVSFRHNLDG
jgi:ribosomal protein S18 acetylase RimI-like enzyme